MALSSCFSDTDTVRSSRLDLEKGSSLYMGEIIKTVLAVIGALGGAAVVVGGLAAWLGKVWADRLFLKESARYQKEIEDLKNQYTIELEHIRAEISERHDLLANTHSALSSGYAASHERIIQAMEELWKTVKNIGSFVSPQIFFYQILAPEEYNNLDVDQQKKVLTIRPQVEIDDHMMKVGQSMEDKRIFIGEKLWLLFYIYRAISYRLLLKVVEQKKNGKFYEWNKDSDGKRDYMENMLLLVFTKKELDTIIAPPIQGADKFGIPQRILDSLERKMLDEMNEWMFGKRLLNMSIEEQQRVSALLKSVKSPKTGYQ